MAAIYLIRHGQASFGKADYDQLSDKGSKQAQILGKHWQALSAPEKIFSGAMLRHAQTVEYFLSAYQQSNLNLTVHTHSGFNEFNHLDVLGQYKEQWQDPNEINAYIAEQQPDKSFQQEFLKALKRWMSGDFDDHYQESWWQFKQRCVAALQDVINQAFNVYSVANAKKMEPCQPTKNVFIFTSGGPISVLIQHVLSLNDQQCVLINQQLVNASVTKLLFSDSRLSVDYINNYSHLELAGSDWPTYR